MLSFSSRILNTRYTIYSVGIGQPEEEIEDELTQYVLAGYIVMICGVQFLGLKQLSKILFITNSILNKTGKFENAEDVGGVIIILPTLCQTNNNVQMTPETLEILKVFQFRKDVIFHNDIVAAFRPFTEKFCNEVAYIGIVLSCMEYKYPNVRPADMGFILSRIED